MLRSPPLSLFLHGERCPCSWTRTPPSTSPPSEKRSAPPHSAPYQPPASVPLASKKVGAHLENVLPTTFTDEDSPLHLPVPSPPTRRAAFALEASAAGATVQLADQDYLVQSAVGATTTCASGPPAGSSTPGSRTRYGTARARSVASAIGNPASMGERQRREVECVKRCLNVVHQFALCGADAGLKPAWVVGARGHFRLVALVRCLN
ncbi:uncharacterized protein BXZ73DRAFT_99429 [Epithele typhae]|uniref:uncharacterized protein n=1 Tax=Epithele typhae TaxID=378194 RepID=UPI0020083833|nr:uncharacterized protein BXZ73DRAFT_99429 [Epithele typhae]KAH9939799.1 hypothetical protein BXZ73DRAFT_99429 [Epithele typhae]